MGLNSRLRSTVGIGLPEIIILAGIYCCLLVASLVVVCYRVRRRKSKISAVPRKVMPFLRPGDNPGRQRKKILGELERSSGLTPMVQPVVDEGDRRAAGHYGWGHPEGAYGGVHFKTSIAKSYLVLERAAVAHDASLERPRTMAIRDYVALLQRRHGGIDARAARHYVEVYEKARFGPAQFTLADYSLFMRAFLLLLSPFARDPRIASGSYELDLI